MKQYLCILMIFSPLFTLNIAFANNHASLASDPGMSDRIQHYFDSGDYTHEIEEKALQARDYLDRRLKQSPNQKFALVLDVDETALSNYEALRQNHFSSNMEAFTASYLLGEQQVIGPILGLFHYAKRRGVDVFFIASRPSTPEVIDATVRNLKQAGFEGWQALYLKPLNQDTLSLSEYKKQMRQNIEQQGYKIIVNIGDQATDLEGGPSELAIKLPNPFYLEKQA